ncbi:protein NDR1-like [Quillaja saponaria]|uniref:Protein NDR1-like n=1 Tax=Quillaja saponaria TaxID=32244 RepID=A0AAD7QHG4_QUISA|nr:protein NDR1-like [Quillaja saponaria]
MSESEGCCKCCCSFILTLGLTALFLWLSLRTDKPKCSIEYFYLPALNKSLNSQQNTSIYFILQLNNPNKDKGIRYENVNLTFSVLDNLNKTHQIGYKTIGGFYQGHNKKAKKKDFVETRGFNGTAVSGEALNNKTVVFRVDFATAVKYKILLWFTKRHKLMLGANVVVDSSGEKVDQKKGIRLKSCAPEPGGYYSAQVAFLVNLLIITFSNFRLRS